MKQGKGSKKIEGHSQKMCYCRNRSTRGLELERLRSGCDVIIRCLRSTGIPNDNRDQGSVDRVKVTNIVPVKDLKYRDSGQVTSKGTGTMRQSGRN